MKNTIFTLIICGLCLSSFAQTDITFTINHKLGSQPFSYNTPAQNNLGHDFMISRLEYYISSVTLTHDGGVQTAIEDLWILVDAAEPTVVPLGNFNMTTLETISYKIGVDSNANHSDPAAYPSGHPLAPVFPSMHWGWAAGYRFVAFEGKGGPGLDQTIELHGLGDQNYFEIQHSMDKTAVDNKIDIAVDADYVSMIEDIRVNGGVIVHGFNRQAQQLLENTRDFTFSLSSGNSAIRDQANIEVFNVFPNPTNNGVINIIVESASNTTYNITIRDMIGKSTFLKNEELIDHVLQVQLPTSGIFLVELYQDGNLVATRKVVLP